MYILGISAYYHDSAAALIKDGEILAAAQEERFSRIKNDSSFPVKSINYCLSIAHIHLSSVDYIVFYDKPFLKFERIVETYYRNAPFGLKSFVKGIPIWIKEKIFFKNMIKKDLFKIERFDFRNTKLLFSEHHLSHAASAFFTSGLNEAAILTIDGVGEWATLSIGKGFNNQIELLKEIHFPDSIGLLYSSFTYYLGFEVNEGEYKMMGLAPYEDRNSSLTKRYIDLIKKTIIIQFEDGSISLNQSYFNYQTGLSMTKDKKWEELFGISRRRKDEEITREHCALACAIQVVTEDVIEKLVKEVKRVTGLNNLCLAGGVALNCVANGKIASSNLFDRVFIQPAAGDAGGAIGAALAVYYMYLNNKRVLKDTDDMKGALLGPEFSERELFEFANQTDYPFKRIKENHDLSLYVANKIAAGYCIGWFQGRMEFGPRALGNRSIIGDPRDKEMQKRMNLKIKYRESFRPFAPAILEEYSSDYFLYDKDSPYMLLTSDIKEEFRIKKSRNFEGFSIHQKLSTPKSVFPAITHVDYSSRLQTVSKKTNPLFYNLIFAFKQLTGCPMIINTSFNIKGEPIVCTPQDAFNCFKKTDIDILVLGNIIFEKTNT